MTTQTEPAALPDDIVTVAVEMFLLDHEGLPADQVDPWLVNESLNYLARCGAAGYTMSDESVALLDLSLAATVREAT